MDGWGKIKQAAEYSGLSIRTMRTLLKQGLRYSRLPSGTILINYKAIDEYLQKFEVNQSGGHDVDRIVDEFMKDIM